MNTAVIHFAQAMFSDDQLRSEVAAAGSYEAMVVLAHQHGYHFEVDDMLSFIRWILPIMAIDIDRPPKDKRAKAR